MIAQCLNGPVHAGDMVRVVLPTSCCGNRKCVGTEYRVLGVGRQAAMCAHCGALFDGEPCVGDHSGAGEPPARVIRLYPPEARVALLQWVEVTA